MNAHCSWPGAGQTARRSATIGEIALALQGTLDTFALPDVLPPGMPVAVVFLQSLQFGTSTLVAGAPSLLVIVQ